SNKLPRNPQATSPAPPTSLRQCRAATPNRCRSSLVRRRLRTPPPQLLPNPTCTTLNHLRSASSPWLKTKKSRPEPGPPNPSPWPLNHTLVTWKTRVPPLKIRLSERGQRAPLTKRFRGSSETRKSDCSYL